MSQDATPRRWRVEVTREDPAGPDAIDVPIGDAYGTFGVDLYHAPGGTTWQRVPQPLLDVTGDVPDGDGARTIGTVERIWRQPDGDRAHVWAEGTLVPGETMPEPYRERLEWVTSEFKKTEDSLRRVAEKLCRQHGDWWRRDLARWMRCDVNDVGAVATEPVPSGSDLDAFLGDLIAVDERVGVPFMVSDPDEVEGIAVPLDNPRVVEQVADWVSNRRNVGAVERPDRTAPTGGPTLDERTARLRQQLDSYRGHGPPDLGL